LAANEAPRCTKTHVFLFLQWLLLALVLISGRYIASWLVKLLVRIIERNFLLKNRVLYFVYGLRKSVANCLWLAQVRCCKKFRVDAQVSSILELPCSIFAWLYKSGGFLDEDEGLLMRSTTFAGLQTGAERGTHASQETSKPTTDEQESRSRLWPVSVWILVLKVILLLLLVAIVARKFT
jgi:hypothetical protein